MDQNGIGVLLDNGATDNLLRGNNISHNNIGVRVSGQGSLRNTIENNSITLDTGKGIELFAGGNTQIAAPIITDATNNLIQGTTTAPNGSVVEIFQDPADEGEKPVATTVVTNGRFRVGVTQNAANVGTLFQINATVTDPSGNTSEFGGLPTSPQPVSMAAFTSTRNGTADIYRIDGFQQPVRLTDDPGNDHCQIGRAHV